MSDSVWPHRWQPTRLLRPWESPGKNTGVGCHFLLQCKKVKSESEITQSCPTLSNPMDCSPPGSSIHGIFPGKSTGVGCHCLLWLYLLDLLFSVLSAKHISNLFKSFHPAQQCDCLEVEVTLRSFNDRFAHMFLSSLWHSYTHGSGCYHPSFPSSFTHVPWSLKKQSLPTTFCLAFLSSLGWTVSGKTPKFWP